MRERPADRAVTRRRFLTTSGSGLALGAVAPATLARAVARPAGADDIRIGVLGLNGRGNGIANWALRSKGVRLMAICDPDQRILDRRAKEFAEKGIDVDTAQDMRRLFDRSDIDAVLVATPNHWHALATIWACESGKDVYVEKPVSHSVWEGRQMVRAAERHGRVVQSGLQNRSDKGLREFKAWFGEGHLGEPEYVHTVWFRRRGPIGRISQPTRVPSEVDYNLFCGPREMGPLMRRNLHYDWHWQFDFGDGELGNSAVHTLDEARWLLDLGMPNRMLHAGERVLWDDDGDTPNVSFTAAEFDRLPMICETRSLPDKTGGDSTPRVRGRGMVTLIVCRNGYFMGGRGGGTAFDSEGGVIKEFKGDSGGTHMDNFFEVVRSRDTSALRTSIEEGHRSSAFCHVSSIGQRLGRQAQYSEIRDQLSSIAPAAEAFETIPRHLEALGLNPDANPLRTSGWMSWDAATERYTEGEHLGQANAMLRASYREPFAVREIV